MKKKMQNRLDEMQEQKMLKVEHNGCWLAFWGLFAALIIQVLIYGYEANSWRYMVGECIVFMCLSLYIAVDCIGNGVWDRHLAPTSNVNAFASAMGGIIAGALNLVLSYRKNHIMAGAVVRGIVTGIMVFILCFAALTYSVSIYRKRVKHLEWEDAEENESK